MRDIWGIFIPNIKFLYLTLWLGWVCPDDDTNTMDDEQQDCMKALLLINQMAQNIFKVDDK